MRGSPFYIFTSCENKNKRDVTDIFIYEVARLASCPICSAHVGEAQPYTADQCSEGNDHYVQPHGSLSNTSQPGGNIQSKISVTLRKTVETLSVKLCKTP